MVDGAAAARRLLRHAGVRRADARRAARRRATRVVGVVTQPDRPRGRGQKTRRRAGQELARWPRACRCCSPSALKDDGVPRRAFAALARRPRRRRGVREDPARRAAAHPAARHDQRARVAAAALSRRRAGAPRGHRRRARDRRHDHARRQGARRRADARDGAARRSAPTRPATRSSATSPSSAPACSSTSLDELADGPRRRDAAGRRARDLRGQAHEGRGRGRLGAAGRAHSQPDPRTASVAARLHAASTARAS